MKRIKIYLNIRSHAPLVQFLPMVTHHNQDTDIDNSQETDISVTMRIPPVSLL